MQDNHMIDQTRRMASDALDRANSRMRDLRSSMTDYASRGAQSVTDYAQYSGRYVSEHPMKSALIAAAIGAAVAGLVLALRHRDDRDYL